MHGRAFSAIYVINIVIESFFSMLVSIGLSVLAGWLLVNKAAFPEWVYVPLILFGVALGFISMYRMISASMRALERIENSRDENKKADYK